MDKTMICEEVATGSQGYMLEGKDVYMFVAFGVDDGTEDRTVSKIEFENKFKIVGYESL